MQHNIVLKMHFGSIEFHGSIASHYATLNNGVYVYAYLSSNWY